MTRRHRCRSRRSTSRRCLGRPGSRRCCSTSSRCRSSPASGSVTVAVGAAVSSRIGCVSVVVLPASSVAVTTALRDPSARVKVDRPGCRRRSRSWSWSCRCRSRRSRRPPRRYPRQVCAAALVMKSELDEPESFEIFSPVSAGAMPSILRVRGTASSRRCRRCRSTSTGSATVPCWLRLKVTLVAAGRDGGWPSRPCRRRWRRRCRRRRWR